MWRNTGNADLIYVRCHPAAVLTALWAKLTGHLMVYELNGPPTQIFVSYKALSWFRPILEPVLYLPLKLAVRIIAVTPQLGRWIRENMGIDRVSVIVNGANTDLFHPDAAGPPGHCGRYALFFGVLAPWQGIDTLLAAARHPSWPRDVRLVIAGEGALRSQLEALGPGDPVTYLGGVPYSQVPGLLAASLCSLIPKNNVGNRGETGWAPLKLFESLAAACPVVVTDIPLLADIVRENQCGIVIPRADPGALASSVAMLASDPAVAKEMGCRGRKAALAEHSWDRKAEQTLTVLREVLEAQTVQDSGTHCH
jgi:glycosyltransferase involved in cell wall biosynthesis